MRIIFRTSEHITNKKNLIETRYIVLKNALKNFPNCTWNVILDNVSLKTKRNMKILLIKIA